MLTCVFSVQAGSVSCIWLGICLQCSLRSVCDTVVSIPAGFEDRKQLYLLYHYLNHYNLFGGGYYSSAEGILRSLTNKI